MTLLPVKAHSCATISHHHNSVKRNKREGLCFCLFFCLAFLSWPQTHCVAKVGLEILSLLSLASKTWDYRHVQPCQVKRDFSGMPACVRACVCMCACMCACMCVHVCMCVCMCACMYMCLSICMCVYICVCVLGGGMHCEGHAEARGRLQVYSSCYLPYYSEIGYFMEPGA